MDKIKDFINKHQDLSVIAGLLVLFYFIFFHNIGNYPLMDVDETRYVGIAREMFKSGDYLSLFLNGDYFFEKPPLYFWGECLSFGLWGGVINEFTARFPVALYGMLSCFLLYFAGKKIVSRSFGVISALILATSMEFVILAKFAILDIVLAVCTVVSVFCGFMTHFCKEENKKYFWWLFYIFSGLAVMAKGIPGFVIPFGVMFFVSIVSGRFKEIFKPQYFLVGFLLFFLITVPWHLIMLKTHDPMFFNEYIIKHHLQRFINSEDLGRKQPFIFMFLTFLWGVLPWTFSAIAAAWAKLREKFASIKFEKPELHNLIGKIAGLNPFRKFKFEELSNSQKFLLFNWIAFIFVMLFFSVSSTKLITYILPIYPYSAVILGFVWMNYIKNGECEREINVSSAIFGGAFIVAGFLAMFAKFVLPPQIYGDFLTVKWFCIILVLLTGSAIFISLYKKNRIGLFLSFVFFMVILSGWGYKLFFDMDYKFGQNDLMQMAKFAKENGYELKTFAFGKRYSVYYYYGGQVEFYTQKNTDVLEEFLSNDNLRVIIRNRDLPEIEQAANIEVVQAGRKYSLIKSGKKL